MILVFIIALTEGFFDRLSNFAVHGKDLKADQNDPEWIRTSTNSITDPKIKLSCSTNSLIHY